MSFEQDELIRMKRKGCLLCVMTLVLLICLLPFFCIIGLGLDLSGSPVFDIVVGVISISLSIISIFMIVKYVVLKKRKIDIERPMVVIPLLIFSIFLWLFLLATGNSRDYFIYKARINPSGNILVINRFRKCAGPNDECNNIIVFVNWRKIYSPLHVVGFQPQGRNMSIKNGLIYFRKEACCVEPAMVTTIDSDGNMVEKCYDEGDGICWEQPSY